MLLGRLDNQKGTRKILVNLLYKKGYCVCIPDPKLIKFYFEQIHPSWIQKFLLSKNALELSVIPMFMLIYVKNKRLPTDQSKRLLELLYVLMSQVEFDTIEQIFFDNKVKQMAWPYYILNELIKFTLDDFVSSDENSKRIMAMAAGIEFFFEKATVLTKPNFFLNTNAGFHLIYKLMYVIAHKTLHPSQIIYLNAISKKIFSTITIQQIELISDHLSLLLINDLSLSNGDRRQIMQDFFAYLSKFCRLQPQDMAILKDLQERLKDRFLPSNKIINFFKQVRTRYHFFNYPNSDSLSNNVKEIALDESSDLLSPEYARLSANYSTVSM